MYMHADLLKKGYNLLEVLKRQHQGLFSRAAVKSILTFLREQSPKEYIHIIDQLLYAQNDDGKDTYRYHLKSLALSNMAFFETPLNDEINYISRKVFQDNIYMDVYMSLCIPLIGLRLFGKSWKVKVGGSV